MSTLADAFLQAICDRPDDDTPRLIFADWLDENGDPDRAEFIRVQCQLEHTPEDADNRPYLEECSAALLEKHRDSWTAPLKSRDYCVLGFRRGFPDRVSVSAQAFLASGTRLFELAPVCAVSMTAIRYEVDTGTTITTNMT